MPATTTKAAPLANHTALTEWSEDNCPQHDTPVRKIYTFGAYGDADVVTFKGCRCAVCINSAALLGSGGIVMSNEFTYHTSYESAAGRATLIKMQEAVANQPFA